MESVETPERVMVVIPHPDDAESGCGGSVAKWIQEGTQVLYVVCTNGDKGTGDLEMTSAKLREIRAEEQRQACEVLGVQDLVMLDYGDGELEDTPEFRGKLVGEIRRFKPDTMLAMDPHRIESHSHRDHRVSGQAALDACFPFARDHLHFAEHFKNGLQIHKTGTVLLWGTERPDVAVDISDTLELKMKALMQHKSQVGGVERDVEGFVKRFAERAAERAEGTGYKYAEAFRKISFRM